MQCMRVVGEEVCCLLFYKVLRTYAPALPNCPPPGAGFAAWVHGGVDFIFGASDSNLSIFLAF